MSIARIPTLFRVIVPTRFRIVSPWNVVLISLVEIVELLALHVRHAHVLSTFAGQPYGDENQFETTPFIEEKEFDSSFNTDLKCPQNP